MISRPTDQADAERAVMNFKHALAVRVMRFIVELALERGKGGRVFPGDVPEEIVGPEHRQGVVSNAWGTLRSLEIIRPISARTFDEAEGIIAGKKANPHEGAKGRMVMVYELADRGKARAWLRANGEHTLVRSDEKMKSLPENTIRVAPHPLKMPDAAGSEPMQMQLVGT